MRVYRRGEHWWADFNYRDADGFEHRWRRSLKLRVTASRRSALRTADNIRSALHAASMLEEHGVALPLPRSERVRCAFSGLAKAWLDDKRVEANKPSTPFRYGKCIKLYLLPGPAGLGHRDVADLRTADIKALRNELASRLAPSTVNQALHLVRAILGYGVREGYLDKNVALAVKAVKRTAGAPGVGKDTAWDWYRADEAAALVRTAFELGSYGALFLTGLQTGLRPGELLALKWEDLTLHGQGMGVQVARTVTESEEGWEVGPPKTRHSRRFVPMLDGVARVLLAHRRSRKGEPSEWVFCRRDGTRLTHEMVRNQLHRVARAAGLRSIRFHDLRHTYASHLVEKGVPLLQV